MRPTKVLSLYQIFDPQSSRDSFKVVNRVEPTFIVQGMDFSTDSQFSVFAQNPVGLSQRFSLSASSIVGMQQELNNPEDDSLFQLIVLGTVLIVGILLVLSCYLLIVSKRKCALRC